MKSAVDTALYVAATWLPNGVRRQVQDALRYAATTVNERAILAGVRAVLGREPDEDGTPIVVRFSTVEADEGWFFHTDGVVLYADGSDMLFEFPQLRAVLTEQYKRLGERSVLDVDLRAGTVEHLDAASGSLAREYAPGTRDGSPTG